MHIRQDHFQGNSNRRSQNSHKIEAEREGKANLGILESHIMISSYLCTV